MAWRVTQGVLLDSDGQPYAWKGQVLQHDDPVAQLPKNRRLLAEVADTEPAPPAPEYTPVPQFRPEPEEDDDDLLGLTPAEPEEDEEGPEEPEGIEL